MYTTLCAAHDQAADLIATARGIEGAHIQWRRMERAGLRRVQQSVMPLFERTRRFRVYQSWVIPGLLQSPAYTRAVLSTVAHLRDVHASPTSSGRPSLPVGAARSHLRTPSGHASSSPCRSIRPGETVLTRMPKGPYSRAAERACITTAALEAE